MMNPHASFGAPRPLRPLLLSSFTALLVACGGPTGDGADVPEPPDLDGDVADDTSSDGPRRGARTPTGDDEAPPDVVGTTPDTPTEPDAPTAPEEPSAPSAPPTASPGASEPVPAGWLYTDGNRIKRAGAGVWQGRGANIAEMRGCNACGEHILDPDEVNRRIDVLVDDWGATFLRLTLESYDGSSILTDEGYLDMVEEIIDHIGTKPGVYVMLSNWISPTFTEMGWPTSQTRQEWVKLAERFGGDKHVLFGLVNEPEENYDGTHDAEVWQAMNQTVQAIRDVEEREGFPPHVIAVQGTGGWSRLLDYYVDHPITAGGGENIAYEVHVYDPSSAFKKRFIDPSSTLPVIIGEFGPWEPNMSLSDSKKLVHEADKLGVPWLAWTFHMRCPPNLIEDLSSGGCGIDMPIKPTPWGKQLQQALKKKK